VKFEIFKFRGIVVSSKANYLNVDLYKSEFDKVNTLTKIPLESKRVLCTRRSRLNHQRLSVHVGDNVFVEEIDCKACKGVVCDVEARKSWLQRPPVANVTNVVVVISLSQPEFNFDQASRFLLTAEQTGLKVSLVLSKSDLVSDSTLNKYQEQLTGWGYQPIFISIKEGRGIDALLNNLRSTQLAVLCGPSGVGKSSLINYLLPNQSIEVSTVSKKLKRGRHTTRNVELFELSNHSLLADTPGFNRPEIIVSPSQLSNLFPELRSQIKDQHCKFRNCLHRDEPGCLIDKRWQRYMFYREYIEELIRSRNRIQED
tara:strand:- start:2871 stop:3812 length:942 start_codon:yes stop_codon:yes gene_type:complete